MSNQVEVVLMNEKIRAPQVRLIGEDGKQIGVMNTRDALNEARNQGLDLVAINPESTPPVCKIIDYGKWNYAKQQAQREQAKKQRASAKETKELQFRPNIAENDLSVKLAKASEFIGDGNLVLMKVKLRGREVTHKTIVEGLLKSVITRMGDVEVVQPIRDQGRDWTLVLGPSKAKKKIQEVA
jgi:translation initiation factor IF-3